MDRIRAYWASGWVGKVVLSSAALFGLMCTCCALALAIGGNAATTAQSTATAAAAVVVEAPTAVPTAAPTAAPTPAPTAVPIEVVPTKAPTPTPEPTAVPTAVPTEAPAPVPAGLGVSREDIVRYFTNFSFAPATEVRGQPREFGKSPDGEINIELIGPSDDLRSTSMLTSLPYGNSDATQGRLLGGATLMLAAIPDEQEKVSNWLSRTYQQLGAAAKSRETFERVLDVDDRRQVSVIVIYFDDGAVLTVTAKVKEE